VSTLTTIVSSWPGSLSHTQAYTGDGVRIDDDVVELLRTVVRERRLNNLRDKEGGGDDDDTSGSDDCVGRADDERLTGSVALCLLLLNVNDRGEFRRRLFGLNVNLVGTLKPEVKSIVDERRRIRRRKNSEETMPQAGNLLSVVRFGSVWREDS
jgi:hypothetical protein